jgi:hypothetical protein
MICADDRDREAGMKWMIIYDIHGGIKAPAIHRKCIELFGDVYPYGPPNKYGPKAAAVGMA